MMRPDQPGYGEFCGQIAAIAKQWSITRDHHITPSQVVLCCMLDLKLVRLAYEPAHRDSATDVIGYAALLPEVTR